MTIAKKLSFLFIFFIGVYLTANEIHEFNGKHLLASYLQCDHEALVDLEKLKEVMVEAVFASGASLLDSCEFVFPPDGLTLVMLLSESHASIHTYPEYNACFVDLFTCGEHCSSEAFDIALRAYLKPEIVEKKLLLRGADLQEID
ncbi:MAG: adenosylmethionine decarboxylase [Chlamydiota bacterium]